ncbi:hypothetical protein P171DRAFT_428697 [Karstenula rhodostoma CBS 690.94]|uniref:F-box domain-containing protein n=1 Tax=Karstenula rhodostoma CBS 690.94 TaxID=1392251 RepID=A0A9P4PR42_9PLEO|nr:hypothetical protein P171DRAFT_428697 [Karstenula rhodostoma CBS 690.94]
MHHGAVQRVYSIASGNAVVRSIARRVDELASSHSLEPVYTAHQFTSLIQRQPSSRLLELPPEVRQLIYRYVFECDLGLHLGRRAYIQLALLETCRLIHSEAHELAFNSWYFHVLDGPRLIKGTPSKRRKWNAWKIARSKKSDTRESMRRKSLSRRLWALGARINHLRYVGITMPHAKLSPLSKDNPFLLTRLPLTELTIGLTGTVGKHWKHHVAIYHNIVGSLLCLSQNATPGSLPPLIRTQTKEKFERFIALKRWMYKPQHTDVCQMLKALETKKVVVRATQNVLWNAFVFFGLFTGNEWGLATPHVDGDRYLHFVEEEELLQGSGVLEFGRVDHRKGGL